MGWKLASQVWELELSRPQKAILQCLCYWAEDDGSNAFPSVKRISYMTEYEERHVKRILRELENLQIIMVTANRQGGRGLSKAYHIDIRKGVKKPPFNERKDDITPPFSDEKGGNLPSFSVIKGDILPFFSEEKGVKKPPFDEEKGDILDIKGDISSSERVTFRAEKGDISSNIDSLKTPHKTPEETQTAPARVRGKTAKDKPAMVTRDLSVKEFVERFNGMASHIPKLRMLEGDRLKVLKQRIEEDQEFLDKFWQAVPVANFYRKVEPGGFSWLTGFDWIIGRNKTERKLHVDQLINRAYDFKVAPELRKKFAPPTPEEREQAEQRLKRKLAQEQASAAAEAEKERKRKEQEQELNRYFSELPQEVQREVQLEAERHTLGIGAKRGQPLFMAIMEGQKESILKAMMKQQEGQQLCRAS